MSKVDGVRWATSEETTLLAVNYYEKPANFKRDDGLVPPDHKTGALAYFGSMLELAARDPEALLKALVSNYSRYTDHHVVRRTEVLHALLSDRGGTFSLTLWAFTKLPFHTKPTKIRA